MFSSRTVVAIAATVIALAGCRVERDDEPNRHGLSSRTPICIDQYHDLPAAASSAPRNGEEAHRASSSGRCRKMPCLLKAMRPTAGAARPGTRSDGRPGGSKGVAIWATVRGKAAVPALPNGRGLAPH